jgi:glycosyltransferase involved in cell wall biosynthesis
LSIAAIRNASQYGLSLSETPLSSNGDSSGTPLVSVVIPAYQCAQYIAQAVASVFDQSFKNLELIVVNDGSPDTTLLESELERFRQRIRYLKQPTRGPSAARNVGILEARGKYVAFLDGDDYWRPEHLAKLLALFQQSPFLELAYCDCILLKNEKLDARYFDLQAQSTVVNFDSILVEDSAIPTSTVVVSREALLRVGLFDESIRRCEDFDLWLRLAFQGAPMAYHADAEVVHRMNDAGLSANSSAMKADRVRVYQKAAHTLPITQKQQQTIQQIIAGIEAERLVEKMKSALQAGDYRSARDFAAQANKIQSNWKLSLAQFVLRGAPGLLRRLYFARAWSLRDRNSSSAEPSEDVPRAGDRESGDRSPADLHCGSSPRR